MNHTVRYSPVAPITLLHQLYMDGYGNGYQLILAHDVLANEVAYQNFRDVFPKDGVLIMDNSVIELGYPLPIEKMLAAFKIVRPTHMVLPDEMLEAGKTKQAVMTALKKVINLDCKFMAVAQGKSVEETVECAVYLSNIFQDNPDRLVLGVPRSLVKEFGSRVEVVKRIEASCPQNIHLLGFSTNMEDDLAAARASSRVKGIDSATPVLMGYADNRFTRAQPIQPANLPQGAARTKWLSSRSHSTVPNNILYNIAYMQGMFS